ncbi:MAG: hypothetical protein A3G52_02315 [Candidatus Taylorbacteria bacterium RIFCSPLOWO2_12_FULL_43_20]|uniref:Cytidyltransferase-like domain-containing protein n=1 Tax=Candidatus Taylorbacteria bacterium RIFCSPLOWO2_12_FULL_43_20 TaxID=1802332 RepID=A0A1G2P3J5_9BACT|nr:MAG: hypothetical protein A3E92_02710 [Candidatus Taylorbacteria bacterium RIFCSPHIGHO2_12_FULL_42_34]OHA42927.1 MAG: hypothetical protein A3G52_02315 [Candidatus Taylorbacteria bacterium RIFCSPLOWO2_12_FULL_43_20]
MKEYDNGKTIFANGIFDLLHPGHIELLKFAKSLGGKLMVGLNSDRSTKILKGPKRPIHNEYKRKMALENLSFVDEVVIFDDVRPTNIICDLMPDIMVKGKESSIEEIRKIDKIPDTVEIVLYPIITDSSGNKISTTNLIKKAQINVVNDK